MSTGEARSCEQSSSHSSSEEGGAVKNQVRLVVGDLECVLGELRSVVGDLKDLVSQIDQVTSKIDQHCSPCCLKVPSLCPRRHSASDKRPPSLPTIPHSWSHHSCPLIHPAKRRPSTPKPWDEFIIPPVVQVNQPSSYRLLTSLESSVVKPKGNLSIGSKRSSATKEDSNNNIKGSSCSSSSNKGSISTSQSSGSYSLGSSYESLTFQYDEGYDPWQKLSIHGDGYHKGDHGSIQLSSYEGTKVIKKTKTRTNKFKSSMAYSISPSHSTSSSNCHEHSLCSKSPVSPSSDYCGVYEKALDERLELEFDDELNIFETIENGIHGSNSDTEDKGVLNASYNRDINTWVQYSGVSMDTVSDDWSDSNISDSCSADDILNDNFVLPLLNKHSRTNSSTTTADYHWRTVIDP